MNNEKWICVICGYIYDPAVGIPDYGIEPGTSFESLPEDWILRDLRRLNRIGGCGCLAPACSVDPPEINRIAAARCSQESPA